MKEGTREPTRFEKNCRINGCFKAARAVIRSLMSVLAMKETRDHTWDSSEVRSGSKIEHQRRVYSKCWRRL